jgi:hypothetical protein
VAVFGESALFAARRGGHGEPAPFALGPVTAPHGASDALQVVELARTPGGTIAVRGTQVPRFPVPLEIDMAAKPAFPVDSDGFADTGYRCTIDPATQAISISGGLPGLERYRDARRALATAERDGVDEAPAPHSVPPLAVAASGA